MAKTIAKPIINIPDFSRWELPKPERTFARASELSPFILKAEGGLSNSQSDSAKAFPCPTPLNGKYYHTNKGITYATWHHVFGGNHDERFLRMNQKDWTKIFKIYYWDKWQADNIYSQRVANVLVDWIWASGVWGVKYPQRMVGVIDDGIVGPKTLTAINNQNKDTFLQRLYDRRESHFRNLAAKDPINGAPNLRGWLNRLENLKLYNEKF